MHLFGQRVKLYGEMWHKGRRVSYHPEIEEGGSALARRMKIRECCNQAIVKCKARELVKSAVTARTRKHQDWAVGDRVYFYRLDRWRGPGIVFGRLNSNLWIALGGKPFLVAPQHVRDLSSDEKMAQHPIVQDEMKVLQRIVEAQEYEDLSEFKSTSCLTW